MKKNLRGKIREFVQSEEGKVGVKSPLTLGVATGGILLAQMIVGTTTHAFQTCTADEQCQPLKCKDIVCRPKTGEGQTCWGICR